MKGKFIIRSIILKKIYWIWILIFVFGITSLGGCSSSLIGSKLDDNGLPKQKYLVGVLDSIQWIASCDGTAYVVDSNTKEIHKIYSMKKGEDFEVTSRVPLIEPALYFIPK